MQLSTIKEMIEEAIKGEFITHIYIPMAMDGHASLVAFFLCDKTVVLKFYDSLSSAFISYEERYQRKDLLDFIRSFLPDALSLASHSAEVLHLLCQGGKDSEGCGYYTLYTALLLRDREELRNLQFFRGAPLLDQTHDKRIRAELAIRTLVAYGIKNVDVSIQALCTHSREGIFRRLGCELKELIDQLEPRLTIPKGE